MDAVQLLEDDHKTVEDLFKRWREALGGRTKFIICGGAALSAELTNVFAAAGVNVLEGYGLTETSPVITYNRPHSNRAGTVGQPIPGVEIRLDEDGEILTRGPHVMKGYFRDAEATAEVFDSDGWFRTGDIGEISEDGFLSIRDRKKDLFKLSTGKYVVPQPIENRLQSHRLIEHAVVVGEGRKYANVLLFPGLGNLRAFAERRGLSGETPIEEVLSRSETKERFRNLVDRSNEGVPQWSTIKNFTVVPVELTIEEGYLTPTMKVRRNRCS
jgi:long-chain acyl-CoA synthetase